ncbi:MAG: beta-ketoacyl-[acyl-carrier-protein] synthase family protein [Endomicrobia bacterium]|nr:beta-ketoacyl-[acyl-carrier-protein] synthase family protein [Endomicrobiia bacterium]
MNKVVITGIGVITAAGVGKKSFLTAVKNNKECLSTPTLIDTSKYYYKKVGEVKEIIGKKNRMHRMLKIAFEEALRDANLTPKEISRVSSEIIIGTAHGPLSDWEYYMDKGQDVKLLDVYDSINNLLYELGIDKSCKIISTACTSSTIAVGMGFWSIKNFNNSIVIIAGVDVLTDFIFSGFASLRAMTRSKCRPFDKHRDGLVLGEGASVVILEERRHADKRSANIYCELVGFSATSDATNFTAPHFTGEGLCRCIQNALSDANVSPQEVSYINAHGTGTVHNDRAECYAIKKVFGEYSYIVPISSIKPIIGHTSGACGAIEVALSALCIRYSFVPANINFINPEEEFKFNFIKQLYKMDIYYIVSINLAFGGNNACCILKKT